jgi:HAD superfamily hydrolase (TIGR01484 family)
VGSNPASRAISPPSQGTAQSQSTGFFLTHLILYKYINSTRILFTDLDGTLLGGTRQDRQRLTDWLQAQAPGTKLVFATGRSFENIQPLIANGELPKPDAIIGDVGTSLLQANGQPICPTIHAEIETRWTPAAPQIHRQLQGIEGLVAQTRTGPRRQSFTFDRPIDLAKACAAIKAIGADPLVSDNQYFDVLPKGIHKGWAVLRLLRHWQVEPSRTLVAGDTLNDLAMFQTGLPAIVVGNAEPALRQALPAQSPHIFRATEEGAAGIWQGLAHYGWRPHP